MANPWFRFYTEVLNDHKVQMLSPDVFKTWVNLLCFAGEDENDGCIKSIDEAVFKLRVTRDILECHIKVLCDTGLLERDSKCDTDNPSYFFPTWKDRQYKSDKDNTAADRKRRQREREKAKKEGGLTEKQTKTAVKDKETGVSQDVTRDVTQKSQPPDTDTDTDTDIKKNKQKKFAKPDLIELENFFLQEIKLDFEKSKIEAGRFFDFYESKGWLVGKAPMKNWQAAVRNWARNAQNIPQPKTGSSQPGNQENFIDRHTDTSWANDLRLAGQQTPTPGTQEFIAKHTDDAWREGL